MTRTLSKRNVSLAALAVSVGVIALAAPSWSCPTRGGNSGSGGNMSQGSDSSRDNGAGERQREGVDAAASEGMDDPAVVGARGSESDTVQVPTAQIGAVSQARASGDAAQCRALQAHLASLTGDNAPDPYYRVKSLQIYLSRITQMTPAMMDTEIASRTALRNRVISNNEKLDRENSYTGPSNRHLDKQTSLLVDLRAAQALGVGVDDVKARATRMLADAQRDADQDAANQQNELRDVRAQIGDLGCANFTAVTSASNQ
jgi:hypothetical protein